MASQQGMAHHSGNQPNRGNQPFATEGPYSSHPNIYIGPPPVMDPYHSQSSPRGLPYDQQLSVSPRGSYHDNQGSQRGSYSQLPTASPRGSQYDPHSLQRRSHQDLLQREGHYGAEPSPRGPSEGQDIIRNLMTSGQYETPAPGQYWSASRNNGQPSPQLSPDRYQQGTFDQGQEYGQHPHGQPYSSHQSLQNQPEPPYYHHQQQHSSPGQDYHNQHSLPGQDQRLSAERRSYTGNLNQASPRSPRSKGHSPQRPQQAHYSTQKSKESDMSRSFEGHYSSLRSNESHEKIKGHSKQPSDASSSVSRRSNSNGYARSPERAEPPMVMEAAQVVEILKRRIAILSGGRDRRGAPVLLLPTHDMEEDFPPQDIIACLSYLASVPSEESAAKGFSVVVDNREGYWRNLRTLFRAIEQSLGGRVYAVYVLRPDQILDRQKLNHSFRKDKTALSFEPQFITLQRLMSFIDASQLTQDLGGSLNYSHETWLNNRLALEHFLREARSVSKHLETAMAQLTQKLKRDESTTPQDLLRQHRYLQESVLDTPEQVIRQGRELYQRFQSDSEAGFRPDESSLTLDQVVAMNQIKRAVEMLENRLDKIQNSWQERDRELSQTVQYSDLESAMKTVIDWIVGPAEKLLRSQYDIGTSYKTADELRKQHEQLELKCTDTYGMYAELRHKVEEFIKEEHEKTDDIVAQRDYMDTVCRSYAARLERRRNLVITSVRFHRLAEELTRRLDDLLELLCTDITAEDLEAVEGALRVLQEKVETTALAADQTVSEGQSLLDQLSLPVKNAFGKDVSPDNKEHMQHVQKVLDDIQERKQRADELANVRKLKLQQILQLRTCERDADQAIKWILELCDVMMASQMELGRSPTEAEQMQVQHQKFESTAKGTYEYGKQLLQAALVLRRSLRYDLEPNNQQGQELANAWKKFSQGINERAIRLNNVFIFNKNADALLENIEEMILVISRCVNLEITIEDLVIGYESSRDHMKRQYDETMRLGEHLLRRLAKPVLTLEGDQKQFTLDDEGTSEVIKGKMALLKTKMKNLKRYWDEQTQGLHLGPSGELLGPDGRMIRPPEIDADKQDGSNNAPKVKHSKHTIGVPLTELEMANQTFESRDQRMAEMKDVVKDTVTSRKSLWDDLMEQTPTKPVSRSRRTPSGDGENDEEDEDDEVDEIIPMTVDGQSLQALPKRHQDSMLNRRPGVGQTSGPVDPEIWEDEWEEVESKLREVSLGRSTSWLTSWAFMAGSWPSLINAIPDACWGKDYGSTNIQQKHARSLPDLSYPRYKKRCKDGPIKKLDF